MQLVFFVLVVLISFASAQLKSHNNGEFCPLVCKNPGNSSGNGGGSSTIVYISKSETIIGFYDSSTQYAFILDWKTQYFLIINVKSDTSAIFSWSTGKAYYISSSSASAALIYSGSGSRETIIAYFKSITTLEAVFQVYAQRGKSFSFNQLQGEAKTIIEGFIAATFSASQQTSFSSSIKEWASFASLIYTTFRQTLRGFGVFEIYASEREIIEFLLHHKENNGSNSSGEVLQDFLKVLNELGRNNANFNNSIEQLLKEAGFNQPSPELIGFLRFIELLSSLNISAASSANANTPLTQFLLPNSPFTAHDFQEILRSTPGLERFLRIFLKFGQNWTAIFTNSSSSSGWGQIFTNIPGLQQFLQFARQNPGFGGFLKLGESFADGVKNLAKSVADLANSFPIPNPFAPVISGFAGGVEGVASQFGNGFHLADAIFGGGSSSKSDESRQKV